MEPLLTHLESINDRLPGLKERLFNWVVDLSESQFDQLCEEIVGLHVFRQKYNGVIVTDETEKLKPFLKFLPKVAFDIPRDKGHYDSKKFYQWLSMVEDRTLLAICRELEEVLDGVLENANTYVIGLGLPALQKPAWSWRIEYGPGEYLPDIVMTINSWREGESVR